MSTRSRWFVRVGKKGRLRLPSAARHKLAVKEGDIVLLEETDNGIMVAIPSELATKPINVAELQGTWSEVLMQVQSGKARVIVERGEKIAAAIVSEQDLRRLQALDAREQNVGCNNAFSASYGSGVE
jgi:AbrB family looped-hinge helix DNA binding protein